MIARMLAARALAPLADADADVLRTLTLTNVAAAVGDRGHIDRVVAALPLDSDRSPSEAAFLHAARLHARTQDDFYPEGRVHVGAIALAATVALADRADGRTLECLAAGYRVMCAVAAVHSADAQRRGLRPSGVFGPFGAAASAAVALGLDEEATANAIALAAAAFSGHNQAWVSGTDEWILEVGAAARAGVEAALFTEAGAKASPEGIEGRAGWAAALFGEAGAERLAAALHGEPIGPSVVATKPHPVSGIAQVPTQLACDVRDALDGGWPPDTVVVRVSPIEHSYPGSSNRGPFRSRSDALMSIAFCVACGLLDGAVPLRRLEDPNADDVRALIERISVEPDPGLEENEAVVEAGGARAEGRAEDILFPRWTDMAADGDALARRSEADPGAVRAAREELAGDAPEAGRLRRILEDAT
jgi:2-methylcitrate dehydratase PrpD